MQSTKNILWAFLFIFCQQAGASQTILSDWKLAKQLDGIKISYRFLNIGDTLETREMGIWFSINASPDEILTMFNNANNLSKWSAGIKECNIIEKNPNSWTTYNLYDIPWPFEQKDLVIEYSLKKSNNNTILNIRSKPKKVAEQPGITRIEDYEGKWIFTPATNGLTKVSFYSISFSKRVLPRFIQDPVIQNIFIESIQTLKSLLIIDEK